MIPTREQIKAAEDRPRLLVPVTEWGKGAQVYVRTMSAKQKADWEELVYDKSGKDYVWNRRKVAAATAICTVEDEAGALIFSADDMEWLNEKAGHVLDRIYAASAKLNGITKDDEDELAKNSSGDRTGDSPSGSPSKSDEST